MKRIPLVDMRMSIVGIDMQGLVFEMPNLGGNALTDRSVTRTAGFRDANSRMLLLLFR